MGSEILAFGSQCSANFQLISDCFIPNFKLKYDDLENVKTDHVNTVIFNLHEIKQLKFFLGHPVVLRIQRNLHCKYNSIHLKTRKCYGYGGGVCLPHFTADCTITYSSKDLYGIFGGDNIFWGWGSGGVQSQGYHIHTFLNHNNF